MSARQPAATAMAAMTMDLLSNGRFMLGLGVSGPQVVEGWYGMPFEKPLARTREYIGILREIWARKGPLSADGPHYPLPLPGGTGLGKPLKSSIHPLREDIPIYLGAEGPKNIALCAELCDGWLAMLFSPTRQDATTGGAGGGLRPPWSEAQRGRFRGLRDGAVHRLRRRRAAPLTRCGPFYALYFGGMGAKGTNFHANVAIRMGYEREVEQIQALYLDGTQGRGGREDPTRADRGAVAGRPAREDPRGSGEVAGVDRHDVARLRGRTDAADDRRARAGLNTELRSKI